jgi:hypothetical protein
MLSKPRTIETFIESLPKPDSYSIYVSSIEKTNYCTGGFRTLEEAEERMTTYYNKVWPKLTFLIGETYAK